MENTLFSVVEDVLRTVLNLPSTEVINMESNLRDDLGLDSMSTLSFLIDLEQKVENFTVNPDRLEADDLKTVGSVLDYITREMNINAAVA
jgi:acyl carrier protein